MRAARSSAEMLEIVRRKDAHLDLCLQEEVGSAGAATGLGGFTLEYDSLPELDLDEVDLSTVLLGRRLRAPLLVGSMTGGTERAGTINARLARAAERVGVGMALGSQRPMLVDPAVAATYRVRDAAPALPLLLGNVGAVQLNYGMTTARIEAALRTVAADGVFFHLNPLQEAIQPEGDTRFRGLGAKLSLAANELGLPVLVKEVGAGIGRRAARKLARLPIAGVEVAGTGGTSWAKVESFRAPSHSVQAETGRRLAGFGISTAASLRICRREMGDRCVIASGGIRTGMDVAVALALGADAVALARPLLEAASVSQENAEHLLATLLYELKVICFCTGARDLLALRRVPVHKIA